MERLEDAIHNLHTGNVSRATSILRNALNIFLRLPSRPYNGAEYFTQLRISTSLHVRTKDHMTMRIVHDWARILYSRLSLLTCNLPQFLERFSLLFRTSCFMMRSGKFPMISQHRQPLSTIDSNDSNSKSKRPLNTAPRDDTSASSKRT